jgi:hypothetical protein
VNVFGCWRRGSIGWWGVTLGVFLLVGCYLVFDVLDLDGSDLQHRLFSIAIASQGAWAEAKQGLHQSLAAPGTHSPGGLVIRLVPLARSLRTLPHPTSVSGSPHVRRIRPRVYAGHESLDPPSSPDDLLRKICQAA